MDIDFPLEFVVEGTPVSLQNKRPEATQQWKERVVAASRATLPQPHFATLRPLSVTLFYFPAVEMQGDIDNIMKPILDALERDVYVDDRQVHRLVIQKFEPGNVFPFRSPTTVLQEALNKTKPLLYIRVSDDPFEDLA